MEIHEFKNANNHGTTTTATTTDINNISWCKRRVLLRGSAVAAADAAVPPLDSSYLHNSPAKSSSGNLWSPSAPLPQTTFLREGEEGEQSRRRRNKRGTEGEGEFSPPSTPAAESELVPSAVAPLGVTYNQNYSPADRRERYTGEITTTTTSRKENDSHLQSGHLTGRQRNLFLPQSSDNAFDDKIGEKIENGQSFDYFNDHREGPNCLLQSGQKDKKRNVHYHNLTTKANNHLAAAEETIRPQMIESTNHLQCPTQQWTEDDHREVMDEELSFMMERYLESSSVDGIVQAHHDVISCGPAGTVQPSPGQQSTDSGFVSDTSHHHHLLTYPDQLMSDPINSGFNSSYDSASFYSGYGQYFGCNEATTTATTTMIAHNDSCPNHQQHYFQQHNCCCLANNTAATTTTTQPSWETENYNTEDLSHIVDQVLNSIDAQFCEDVPNATGSSNWTSQTGNLQTVAPMQQVLTKNGEDSKALGEKIELCDNCGNMMDQPEQSSCGNCGHLLQRNNDPDIPSFPANGTIDTTTTKKTVELGTRVCAVQPAVRNVGVVEPRVVVKIPWAKLKNNFADDFRKASTTLNEQRKKCESNPTSIELNSSPLSTSDESTTSNVVQKRKRKDEEVDLEESKRKRKTEEGKDAPVLLQPFSITEKLPEHFRQALRAQRRCTSFDVESGEDVSDTLNDDDVTPNSSNNDVIVDCCKSKKKRKKRKRERRRNRDKNTILTFPNLSDQQTDQPDLVVNRLKLVRRSTSSENFKIKIDKQTNNHSCEIDSEMQKDLSSNLRLVKTEEQQNETLETGFSRYKDTCLDFGDLVRQSQMKLDDTNDRQWSTYRGVGEVNEEVIESNKKHRHSKCKKHQHRSSTTKKVEKSTFVDEKSLQMVESSTEISEKMKEQSLTSIKPQEVNNSSTQVATELVQVHETAIKSSNNNSFSANSLPSINPPQSDNESALFNEQKGNRKVSAEKRLDDFLSMPVLFTEEEGRGKSESLGKLAKNDFHNLFSLEIGTSKRNSEAPNHTPSEKNVELKTLIERTTNNNKEEKEKTGEAVEVERPGEEREEELSSKCDRTIGSLNSLTVTNERKSGCVAKFLVEKETDGKWLYCKVEGCHFWTRKQIRMSRHTSSHIDGEENRLIYQCPDCKLRISSLPKLLRHDRKFHTGYKDYECKICEAEVTDISVHMRVHRSEKQFSCNICSIQFRHKNSLVRHLFQHSGERPFRCQNCEASFTSIHRMREHIKKRHPTSQAAQSIGIENNYLNVTPTRSYPPIAPAPAPAKIAPATTLVIQQQQPQPQPMTSILLPNGMLYFVNPQASQQTFQQPLLVSMPTQQHLFLGTPGLQTLGSQFLSTGTNGAYFLTQPSMTMAPQQPIFLNAQAAAAPSAQLPVIESNPGSRVSFMDGSFRLESNDRLTYKSQTGETVKLDILERAILEIPNLANDH